MADPTSMTLFPCFGISALGLCSYNPASPTSIYFSLGEAIGALAFTLAVQQLLRPIYQFRLNARYLPLTYLYLYIFAGFVATLIAAILPGIPALHGGPWGYANVWEIAAAALFFVAYGAVALAIVMPVTVGRTRILDFARGVAGLLSAAHETDHVDLVPDLLRSLPRLIETAAFVESRRETSAFHDFIYRHEIERASYARSLLLIIADPPFCETLVKRAPWRVAEMLGDISEKRLYARSAEQFVRELAQQAILRDDGMMAREVGYHGFGSAPLLSESLFSDPFIIEHYNPFGSFFGLSGDLVTPEVIERFNSAAERCYGTLIREHQFWRSQAAYSIRSVYRSVFGGAYSIRKDPAAGHRLPVQMHSAVEVAIEFANRLLAEVDADEYQELFVIDPKAYRSDVLETLEHVSAA